MQMFASSPGAWKPPIVQELRTADLVAARREFDIDPLFIHAIYLINLASADPLLVNRSKASLVATLQAGSELAAAGIVTHIGSHQGRGFETVSNQIASSLLDILAKTPPDIDLVLENSAGAGGIIGSSMEELAELLELSAFHPRLKVALDTAHLCGAGWDFSDSAVAASLAADIERSIGLDRLVLIHANDSKQPPASRRDRHANVGEGHIGDTGFRSLLVQPALTAVPWIVETPDLDTRLEADERFGSVATLRRLRAESCIELASQAS